VSSVLICSTPVHGHVAPLLDIAQHLVARGDRVRFLTGQRFREKVIATGAEFVPLPAGADFDDTDVDASFPGRVGLKGPAQIRFDISEIFLKPTALQVQAVSLALASEPTDAVLAESMFAGVFTLLFIPREDRPLLVNLGIVPLTTRSRDTAPWGLGIPPMPGPIGRVRNRLLQFIADRVIFAPVEKHARAVLSEIVGRPLTDSITDWQVQADVVAQFTVESFEYPRSDLPAAVRFVGPVSRGRPSSVALPDWWHELDGSRPVVHVTQGTVANRDYSTLIAPTMAALADEDLLVVVSTGGRPVDSLGTLPANVRAAEFLPYDKLLPLVDVYVTNGGYGGVHFALEHGVPLVVAGLTEDKAEVSARVAWSGVGINLKSNSPTPRAIAKAVRAVLSDERYRRASQRIGAEIAASPGLDAITELVSVASRR
jgi:MGT family glycosyltransferase